MLRLYVNPFFSDYARRLSSQRKIIILSLGGSRVAESVFFFKLKINFKSLYTEKKKGKEADRDVTDGFHGT